MKVSFMLLVFPQSLTQLARAAVIPICPLRFAVCVVALYKQLPQKTDLPVIPVMEIGADMRTINRQIGKRIRILRESKSLSQEALADKSEIYRSHMGAIERGNCNLTIKTLAKVAQALNVSFVKIFRGVPARRASRIRQ